MFVREFYFQAPRIKSCTGHGKTFNAMKSMPKWEKRLKRQKSRPDEAALVGVA